MTKKSVIYVVLAVLFLFLCYTIGQVVKMETMVDESTGYYDYVAKNAELVYIGKEDAEVLGNSSVGLVEDAVYGIGFLMTPDTEIHADVLLDKKTRTLMFTYMIHRDVADISDGMELQIEVIRKETGEVLYKDVLEVGADVKQYELMLSAWKEQNINIVFMADNVTEDRNGDWLIIKNAKIE